MDTTEIGDKRCAMANEDARKIIADQVSKEARRIMQQEVWSKEITPRPERYGKICKSCIAFDKLGLRYLFRGLWKGHMRQRFKGYGRVFCWYTISPTGKYAEYCEQAYKKRKWWQFRW